MKVFLTLFLFCMMLLGCHRSTSPSTQIASSEYNIYGFVIRQLDDPQRYAVVAVNDSTLSTDPVPEQPGVYRGLPPGSYTPRDFKELSMVWPDFDAGKYRPFFVTTNLVSYKLSIDSLQMSPRIRARDRRRIDQSPDSALFYHGKLLLVWFSRVAFDSTGSEALLYTEHICGGLCGEGIWFWLKRSGDSWIVYKKYGTWVS